MTHPVSARTLALLAGVGLLAVPSPGSAQYTSIPIGGGYNVYRSRFQQFSVPFMTPNGPATAYYRNAGFRPYRRATVVSPYYGGGYMGGGVGTGGYNPVAAKRAADLAAAQRAGGQAFRAARGGIADQYAYERGARPAAKPDDLARAAGLVDRDLLTADPAEIASGAALNGLLGAVEPLQAKPGKPVDSPLLGPDLASRVEFAGGPNADALNLLRAGRLTFPAALRTAALADWRTETEAAYTAAIVAAGDGKAIPEPTAARLRAAAARGRDADEGDDPRPTVPAGGRGRRILQPAGRDGGCPGRPGVGRVVRPELVSPGPDGRRTGRAHGEVRPDVRPGRRGSVHDPPPRARRVLPGPRPGTEVEPSANQISLDPMPASVGAASGRAATARERLLWRSVGMTRPGGCHRGTAAPWRSRLVRI